MMLLEPGEVVANRRLVKLLSEGGMGEVWLATKLELDKPVVLKFILPQFAAQPQFRQLFEREARLVAQLDHPNIVRVFDFGRLVHSRGDILWFEQEYIRGADLASLLKRFPRGFPAPLAMFIVGEALKGLLFAHEYRGPDGTPQPVIHRDIKPHNILVADEGSVHLVDFGIAKVRGDGDASTLAGLKGTFGYIAPEHVMGQPADQRSDLFSMGLVFWEALGAPRLFAADNEQAVLWKTAECIVPPLAQQGVLVPPPVEAIVRRLLAREPSDRYQSAWHVLDDLRNAPGGRDADSLELKAFLAGGGAPPGRFAPPASGPGLPRTLSAPPRGEIGKRSHHPSRRALYLAVGAALVVVAVGVAGALLARSPEPPPPAPAAPPAPVAAPAPPDAPPATVATPDAAPPPAAPPPVVVPDAPPPPKGKPVRVKPPQPRDENDSLRIKLPGDD